ncbi:MAG: winged helix-turn-helix domain-containing protein [Longimicrobiales bacterium]|nr:winged helix-turn-helix domain-containing protein [Longimicrobiales bacterium]
MTARQRGTLLKLLFAVTVRAFGVTYHPAHVWKILRGEGWSCQKPERRARERDEATIQCWRAKRRPHIEKRPQRQRIAVEWLPPYAPDLNPVEHVWGHGDLANFTPCSLPALEHAVLTSLAHTRGQRHVLTAFLRAAGLEL